MIRGNNVWNAFRVDAQPSVLTVWGAYSGWTSDRPRTRRRLPGDGRHLLVAVSATPKMQPPPTVVGIQPFRAAESA